MKLKVIGAIAAAVAATTAGAGALAYAMFNKVIIRKDNKNAADINMGTDWDKYRLLIREKREWLSHSIDEELFIQSNDGLLLAGKYIKSPTPTHKTVIAVHGYKSSSTYEFAAISEMYHKNGYNVLLIDNRAHGDSEGKYIGFGVLDRHDLKCWIDYFIKNIDAEAQIYLHGISMGGATVLFCADLRLCENVKAIIADCAFTNAYDVMANIFDKKLKIPSRPLLKATSMVCKSKAGYAFDEISTLDAVRSIKLPVLFIHGAEDDFVPTEMSKMNYNACGSEDKHLFIVEGADHAESFYYAPEAYEYNVIEFLKDK